MSVPDSPAFSRASRITRQLASHISSISRSVKPGLGINMAVSIPAEAISRPFSSKMAALVEVPPLSSPR